MYCWRPGSADCTLIFGTGDRGEIWRVKQTRVRREREQASGSSRPLADAPKLDRLIHERLRLGILSALSVNESLTFNELKKLLDTTDGNLSVHARKLEEAGYVACTKSFEGRMPRTDYRLTAAGQAGARAVSGSHGSADPGHAGEVGAFFYAYLTLHYKVLCMSASSWMATAAGPRAAACRASRDTAPASRRCAAWWRRRPTRSRHPDAVRLFLGQLAAPAGGGGRADAPAGGVPGKRDAALRREGRTSGGDRPPRPAGRERCARPSRAAEAATAAGDAPAGCGWRWTTRRATPFWPPRAALRELSRDALERAWDRRWTC